MANSVVCTTGTSPRWDLSFRETGGFPPPCLAHPLTSDILLTSGPAG
jgi:hypothetical protein